MPRTVLHLTLHASLNLNHTFCVCICITNTIMVAQTTFDRQHNQLKEKMQAKIIDSTIIYPSEPPFVDDHVLPLSHLDTDHNLYVTFRYLRVYVNSTSQNYQKDPFDVITTALSSALVPYYQFAGTLRRRDSDKRLELCCQSGQGVPVIRASVDCCLKSLNYLDDDVDDDLVDGLVPNPDPNEALNHPMTLQLTKFECGGFVLGAAIYFALCDGIGATDFFNVMAELARGASHITVQPVWDRQILLGPRNPPRIEFPIHEFLSLERGFVPYLQNNGVRVVRRFFHVKDEWLDRLKSVLLDQCGSKFTTFEALGAFIWRTRVKCSKSVTGNEKVKFSYQINIRKLVKPPLPKGYWGNGCVPMYAQLSAKDLTDQPLWKTASLIKKSKYDVSDEYVRSYIDFQALHFDEGITAGTRVNGFTDWRHIGHSGVDFGWGGPVTVFPLSNNLLGSVENCFFLPYSSLNEDGMMKMKMDGFKVLVYVQEDDLADFTQEMGRLKYIENDFF